jgi:hypothetical protein
LTCSGIGDIAEIHNVRREAVHSLPTVAPHRRGQRLWAQENCPPTPLDQWLDRIAKDSSRLAAALKVARNKPEDLVDACWTEQGEKISE